MRVDRRKHFVGVRLLRELIADSSLAVFEFELRVVNERGGAFQQRFQIAVFEHDLRIMGLQLVAELAKMIEFVQRFSQLIDGQFHVPIIGWIPAKKKGGVFQPRPGMIYDLDRLFHLGEFGNDHLSRALK